MNINVVNGVSTVNAVVLGPIFDIQQVFQFTNSS